MNVTDTLQTLLKLDGGPSYGRELESAAKKLDAHAKAEEAAKERSQGLKAAFNELGGSTALLALELASVVGIVGEAVKAFAEEEEVVFRTTLVLKNLGNSFPIEKAEELARSLRASTSVSTRQAIELVGLEKRFGVADDQIEKTTKTILDFAAGTGQTAPEAGEKFLRAMLGQGRGLKRLGIQFEDTGNKAKNLEILQKKIAALFGGGAEAERNTLAKTFETLKNSLEDLLVAVGGKLATVIVPILNKVIDLIGFLTSHVAIFTTALGAAIGGALGGGGGALIGGAIGLGIGLLPGKKNPAEEVGNGKEKLATEDTLQQIEQNTAKTAEAFVKGILGGPGTIAKAAFTARDAKLAFGI